MGERATAEIISVGTELTLGLTTDTNAAWLSRELAARGWPVARHLTVADDEGELVRALAETAGRAALAIVTGGLGPTADDLTRQAFALAFAAPLALDETALAELRAFFSERDWPWAEANRVQALFPAGAEMLPNGRGTAPGFALDAGGCRFFALPGVPGEMKAMFAAAVAPRLPGAPGGEMVLAVKRLHTCGLGEATLGERLRDLMAPGRAVNVGLTAGQGLITVTLSARAGPGRARSLLARTAATIKQRLGPAVFGEDAGTLEQAVAALLLERGWTLALGESCTAGLVAARLGSVPGISGALKLSVVAYANEAKTDLLGVPAALIGAHGAVSGEVAAAMARGARERGRADLGLAVTGVAGPGGGSAEKPVGLVWFALAGAAGERSWSRRFGGDREHVRQRAAIAALDGLRRQLTTGEESKA